MAVEAMRVGAYNFLEKPFNPDTMSQLQKGHATTPNFGQSCVAPRIV